MPTIKLSFKQKAAALALATVAGVAPVAAPAQERAVPPSREALQYSYSPIVKMAAPAVVNVYVRSRVRTTVSPFANDPFFQRFFGGRGGFGLPQERIQSSLGSGVIISPDGVIVTNTHVVRGGTDTQIRVALADKREYDARIVAQDERTDLAVLKIEKGGTDFPYLQFADSDKLEVGDVVLAIGNPFGVGQTVTSGIISALARTEMAQSDTQVFLQTDAAINPGNSGGALVDMNGRLAGINTMIFSQSGGSVGIGFAIPSNLVRLVADNAIAGRKIERPWLGAQLETVTREMATNLGLERISGAVVVRLTNNSPAARAGLQLGDVIVAVDGFEVADAHSVHYRLTTRGVGNNSRLDVIRSRKRVAVEVTLVPAPKPGKDDVRNLSGNHPFDGARVSNILPSVADEFNLDETDGVVIIAVRSGGVAARLDFQPGDIIVQIGNDKITDVVMLDEITRTPQRIWSVTIKRGGRLMKLQMSG
ncbi:MAG: Do family serine endopeptidase [Hyphomicrobium sp.]|uniref:Do family serine endopeptidase n=1 Tax=Hyphomicrobium sp. TaxID=82 RepID=UPI001323D53C|nr:Do family serine endopeptidase [Hyphomicrobium sp.]KAB2942860.1 MAG: Do family serine endopeptidase [Hyphomicrobium sp.]MBZ0211876.1 Do family serine endopeptidase [Hyphomicrobium sp.]